MKLNPPSNATDISSRIYNNEQVLKTFFNVRTVVSIEDADRTVRAALNDYGLKLLTDQDLKAIQRRIGATTENQRINLGFVDFFGFDREFFRHFKGDELKGILFDAVQLKSKLDLKVIEFIQSKIASKILIEITNTLLFTGKIHPFSVTIASPYLFKRLVTPLMAANFPLELAAKFYPDINSSKEALLNEISERLFATSEMIFKGDYNGLVGDEEMVNLKKQLYERIHSGLTSVDQIRQRFAIDIEILKPVLDKIEADISSLMSASRTVLIKDISFLSSNEEMEMLMKTIQAIESKNA